MKWASERASELSMCSFSLSFFSFLFFLVERMRSFVVSCHGGSRKHCEASTGCIDLFTTSYFPLSLFVNFFFFFFLDNGMEQERRRSKRHSPAGRAGAESQDGRHTLYTPSTHSLSPTAALQRPGIDRWRGQDGNWRWPLFVEGWLADGQSDGAHTDVSLHSATRQISRGAMNDD